MRYSIISNLRIFQVGKTCFPLGKIEFLTLWKFYAYRRIFGIGKALNIYINYHLMLYPSRQHVK